MDSKGIYEDLSIVVSRAHRLVIVVEIIFAFLFIYYWKIQILDHGKFWRLSESNRVRETVLIAPRGLITDRKDVLIATNVGSFRASLVRENSRDLDASYKRVSQLLRLDEATVRERVAKYASLPAFRPIVVQDNLTMEDVSRIEARKIELPELLLESEPKRFYPFGSFASHVLGYMQELSEADVRSKAFKTRQLGDLVGKMGLESVYEKLLSGENGLQLETVDSLGRNMGEFERQDPRPSPGLKLTLDYDLQKKAEEMLAGREGAIVVLDARTGGVLALASFPTYEPNRFINRFSPEEWQGLIADPTHPLENRAIRGQYSPGSVFKLTMSLAALDSGTITDSTSFFCGGAAQIYGTTFNCWKAGGHGSLILDGAIQNSCNVFFYNVARRMDVDTIARYARILGFGSRTGIDLPGEKEGLVQSTEWKKKTFKAPWFPGETISVGIGQGPLLVTPLQIAASTAFIARRGIKVFPHLVSPESPGYWRRWTEASGGAIPPITQLKRSDFERVVLGMYESVNKNGTGAGARVEGLDVCGKTGSTQTMSRERAQQLATPPKTHSWFTGFGPRDNPEIVVTVLVEFGGMGGATAAPLAGQLFALYKQIRDRQAQAAAQ